MKRILTTTTLAVMLGGLGLTALAPQKAEAQLFRRNRYRYSHRNDRDRDGIRNRYDRDRDGDGIINSRDPNPDRYNSGYRYRVRGYRATTNDWDGDGYPNWRDRYPRHPRRH